MMGTTESWKARQPQRMAGLVAAGQNKRSRSEALSPDDLFASLVAADGVRLTREALRKHLGWQPLVPDVLRVVEAAFPTQVEARRAAAEAERQAAEKRRREAAREAAATRRAAAEQEAVRQRVEQLRAERHASEDAALLETARAELAAK
jgi:hypothetical protein